MSSRVGRASEAPEHIPVWVRIQWPDKEMRTRCGADERVYRKRKKPQRSRGTKPVLIITDSGVPVGVVGSPACAARYIGRSVQRVYHSVNRDKPLAGYILRYATAEDLRVYPIMDVAA
jgi:hypothetical protein